jgi:hypothetical protein
MLILTIIVGFAMMTLGVALLLLGEVPFIAGKRIPALRARLIGCVLISFLPLSWGVLKLINLIFGPDTVEGPVVTPLMFSLCWVITFGILFRVLVPKRAPVAKRPTPERAAKKNPFGSEAPAEIETSEPTKQTSVKKSRKPAVEDSNPFDFN